VPLPPTLNLFGLGPLIGNIQQYEPRSEKWKSLTAEQSAEQGKTTFALFDPLAQCLVVGFLFLENNQLSLLLFCVFSLATIQLSSLSLYPFSWLCPYFCEFCSF
jgi:hypothetical protein